MSEATGTGDRGPRAERTSYAELGIDPGRFAAGAPHCGVCHHVTFLADWERTPYCTLHELETGLDVGEVCSAFESTVR